MREVARSIVGRGTTKGDLESHFTRLLQKSTVGWWLEIKGCGMWQLPRGEKLASSEQRTVDLMGSEAPMTTQEPSKFYKPSFDLTENMMVVIVNSRPWKPPPLYCVYFSFCT
jgi:hypothetical protein